MEQHKALITRSAILPTHSIKLRWLGKHLEFLKRALQNAFEGEFVLNDDNPDLYFKWVGESRPHQQPPALTTRNGKRHVANREVGYGDEHKELTQQEKNTQRLKWSGGVGKHGTELIAHEINQYIRFHPQKKDGISLLVLSPDGERNFTKNVVESVVKKLNESIPLTVNVIANPKDRAYISESLNSLDADHDDTNLERSLSMMPLRQVQIHNKEIFQAKEKQIQDLIKKVDVAITADMFSDSLKLNDHTQDPNVGTFDPLFDTPVHHPQNEESVEAHVNLIPSNGDSILENWATLSVQQMRGDRVNSHAPHNTDFWKAVVALEEQGEIYKELHEYAHWVITLDRFVNRTHIDAINQRALSTESKHFAIIDVKEKVGENRLYTLITSSSSGKDFIQRRFAAKLQDNPKITEENDDAFTAATILYEAGRQAVPGKLLRALGSTEHFKEIIGSILARKVISDNYPILEGKSAIEIYLSLDDDIDHLFPSTRADFVRVLIYPEENEMELLVCEAKFGSPRIADAINQVKASQNLLKNAFSNTELGKEPDDKRFWVRELSNAIEQLPQNSTHEFATVKFHGEQDRINKKIRQLIMGMLDKDRGLTLTKIEGAVFVTNVEPGQGEESEIDGFPVFITRANDLADFFGIDELSENLNPIPSNGSETVKNKNPNWSDSQLREAVNAYLDLWERQQSGESVTSKKETLIKVSENTGRTEGSVEMKMCNLSHGMEIIGFDYISGWKPLPNRNRLEHDILSEALETLGYSSDYGEDDEDSGTKEILEDVQKGMTEQELEEAYQILLNLLGNRVTIPESGEPPYKEGPAFYRMRVELSEGSTVNDVTRSTEELKVRLRLEQGKEIRSFIDKGHIVFEIPKLDHQRYWIEAERLWTKSDWPEGDLFAPLGEDIEGAPIGINFSDSATAHLLIAGSTGSGKSVALETVLYGLCRNVGPENLRLHLVDPKGVELIRLEDDPRTQRHIDGQVGYDAADAIDILSGLVGEMENRYRVLFRNARARDLQEYNKKVSPSDAQPWHVVVLDEYNDLVNEKEDKETIKKHLVRLAQKGRAAGIHVIVATQRPDATVIDGVIRTNLPAALALATSRAIDSRVILDENGAEALCAPGEALFSLGGGKLERIQVAQVKDE